MAQPTIEKLRKIISFIIVIPVMIAILFTAPPENGRLIQEITRIVGYLLIIAASFGRVWCAVFISGRKNKELCQAGPYSLCRNPLYFFSFLGMIGLLAVARNLPLVLVMIPTFLIYYNLVIRSEEKRLGGLFGKAFPDYCSKVNRFLPSFRGYKSLEKVEIVPRRFLREMRDAMVFLLMLIPIEIISYLKGLGGGGDSLLPVWWHMPF
jgi:protein-S-isoprenylcysteine O-methyltransferase Ste14